MREDKMATIKLYYNRQNEAYIASEIGAGWSLEPYGNSTEYYSGETEQEAEYVLPDGYRLGRTQYGAPQIYYGDTYCPLITDDNGNPRLCTPDYPVHGLPLIRC
jgi:hypothetical protein